MRMVKDIKNRIKINWKIRLYEHLAIQHACAADAELFGIWIEIVMVIALVDVNLTASYSLVEFLD